MLTLLYSLTSQSAIRDHFRKNVTSCACDL